MGHRRGGAAGTVAMLLAAAVFWGVASPARGDDPTSVPCVDPAADDEPAASPKSGRLRADEMPAIDVVGKRESDLREEERIGPNEQPRWTAYRRFPSTRIYVLPPWQVNAEYWLRAMVERHGPNEYEHRQELEVGLPYRFQFDFYLIETHDDDGNVFVDQSFELRYAFAKWGRIPANPTAYFEWVHREGNRPEKFELKFLFGDEIVPRWRWGTNLIWEQDLGATRETVVEWTPALSYTILDEKLAVGIEGKLEVASEEPHRNRYVPNLRLGPSVQWRPMQRLHVDVAPLFGFTSSSREGDLFLIVGWAF